MDAVKLSLLFISCAMHVKGVTVDTTGCGTATKGCFGEPENCVESDSCDMLVTFSENGANSIDVGLMVKTQDWVAVGFSQDAMMADSPVMECVKNGASAVPGQSYNAPGGWTNQAVPDSQLGFTNAQGEVVGGVTRCSFTRSKTVSGGSDQDKYADLTQDYFLLLARGPASGGVKVQHSSKIASTSKGPIINSNFGVASQVLNKMHKAHGCLMVAAWVITSSIGILLARYYKDAWRNRSLCGKDVWFGVHRICMVLTFSCCVAAFVIIFVDREGFSEINSGSKLVNAHPYLGIAVTALCIANPIMALFRCHPGEPNRYLFNWAHWAVGTIAYVAAQLTIYLGLRLPASRNVIAPEWLIWLMVAFNAFHILIELILEIHRCCRNKREGGSDMIEMKETNQWGSAGHATPSDTFRNIVLACYVVVAIGLGAAIIVVIAIQ